MATIIPIFITATKDDGITTAINTNKTNTTTMVVGMIMGTATIIINNINIPTMDLEQRR
jgi:hypothetical protein